MALQIYNDTQTRQDPKKESNKIDSLPHHQKKIIYLDKRTRADVTSLELKVRETLGNGHGLSIYLSPKFFHNQSQVSKVAFCTSTVLPSSLCKYYILSYFFLLNFFFSFATASSFLSLIFFSAVATKVEKSECINEYISLFYFPKAK